MCVRKPSIPTLLVSVWTTNFSPGWKRHIQFAQGLLGSFYFLRPLNMLSSLCELGQWLCEVCKSTFELLVLGTQTKEILQLVFLFRRWPLLYSLQLL